MATKEDVEKRTNMSEIIKKARAVGIDPGKMKKAELVRSIQAAEDCTPCFGASDGQCAHTDCCFMLDCFKNSLTEHAQTERHLKQQIDELTAANEQLQQKTSEHQQTKKDMEQYCNRFEEQAIELAAANDKLQYQTAERQRLEQCFVQLQAKLENISSIIDKQSGLEETGPKVLKSLDFAQAPPGCTYN